MAIRNHGMKMTALYERLSKDDEQKGESNSIINQKRYLEEFAQKKGFGNIRHFTDDGFTGRNFNRPGFQSMLEEAEAGNIGTVIVKDMSRFGRNYLQVGFYTEIYFPEKGVRFIAVNNSVDSEGGIENEFTPFLNIMNEWYAKDTSKKIKSIFDARMSEGKRCSGSIPYGYNRLPNDKQTLVVDPVSSKIVRRIFEMADGNMNAPQIARKLTEEKVLIPSAYSERYHPEQCNGKKYFSPYEWSANTVRGILDRREYLGHTVLKKSVGTNFKTDRRRATDEDEQYIFYDTHEPIVSKELWDSVQKRRKRQSKKTPHGTYNQHKLSGYLFCADCGARMQVQSQPIKRGKCGDLERNYYYRCGSHGRRGSVCSYHYVSANAVENLILTSVRRMSMAVVKDEGAFLKRLETVTGEKAKSVPMEKKKRLAECEAEYEELDIKLKRLYENFFSGLVPERQYKTLMEQYDREQKECGERIEALKREVADIEGKPVQTERFMELIRRYREPEELTGEMMHDFIDKVMVHEAAVDGEGKKTQEIEIYYNFIGCFEMEPLPEEIEAERIAREELRKEREARAKEKQQERYLRRKQERYDRNDGHRFPKTVCEECGKEFYPTGNKQKYCCKKCYNKTRVERVRAKRFAEKGNHKFRQKNCTVCGKPFWPVNGQEVMCSAECKHFHRKERAVKYYHEVTAVKEKKKREEARKRKMMEKSEDIVGKG